MYARSCPPIRSVPVGLAMTAGLFLALAAPVNASPMTNVVGSGWAWGSTLGNGSAVLGSAPTAVSMPAGVRFTAISAGNGDDLAIDSKGHAWAWGENLYGDLGNGTTTGSLTPVAVSMPPGVTFTAISAGDQGLTSDSLALDSTGHAWAWGANDSGELGNATTTGPDMCSGHPCSTTPVEVSMPLGVTFTDIAAGALISVALDSTGHAWAWGFNGDGELGNGTTTDSSIPVQVSMPNGVTFTRIAAGGEAAVALDSTGHAWAWGFNGDGELGNGSTTNSSVPAPVSMPSGVAFTSVALGSFNSLALDGAGHVWAWGTNQFGDLGTGTTAGPQVCVFPACSTTPVAVDTPHGVTFTAISAGQVDDLVLDSTGQAWAWGDNDSGQLGIGTTTGPELCGSLPCSSSPLAVSMPPGVIFTAVSEGNDTSLALSPEAPAKVATTTVLSSALDPAKVGQQVTYTATIGVVSPATGSPTGTVGFTDNGTPISGCSAVVLLASQASCTVTYAKTGSHVIVATYSGDANFAASTSPELGETVIFCSFDRFGCDLFGANLVNADLAGQTFALTNLAQGDLADADLKGTVLFLTNLDDANLTGANLVGAKVAFVDLSHVNFTNANLEGAIFLGVNVSGATWSNTICPDGTNSNADGGTCVGHL